MQFELFPCVYIVCKEWREIFCFMEVWKKNPNHTVWNRKIVSWRYKKKKT